MNKLQSQAKAIDDSFHEAILSYNASGFPNTAKRLSTYQRSVFNLLNKALEGLHPNRIYYNDFFKRHEVNKATLDWLGGDESGDAYDCGDGRIFNLTRSPLEYSSAINLLGKSYTHITDYYVVEKVGSDYYILMEDVDQIDPSVFEQAVDGLSSQGLTLESIALFDVTRYKDTFGVIPNRFLLKELAGVVRDLKRAGLFTVADIRAEVLGWSEDGRLKAFLMEGSD